MKIITDSGEVITYNNLLDRANEYCVFRPKVQRFYEAHCNMNILTETEEGMSTQRVMKGDSIILEPKNFSAFAVTKELFKENYDFIVTTATKSEC